MNNLEMDSEEANLISKNHTGSVDESKSHEEGKKKKISFWEGVLILIKGHVGTGLYSLPIAFEYSGLLLGVIGMLIMSAVNVRAIIILIESAHILSLKTGIEKFTYPLLFQKAMEQHTKLAPYAKMGR